eukprot:237197-Prymnesium_polylepis.4
MCQGFEEGSVWAAGVRGLAEEGEDLSLAADWAALAVGTVTGVSRKAWTEGRDVIRGHGQWTRNHHNFQGTWKWRRRKIPALPPRHMSSHSSHDARPPVQS